MKTNSLVIVYIYSKITKKIIVLCVANVNQTSKDLENRWQEVHVIMDSDTDYEVCKVTSNYGETS